MTCSLEKLPPEQRTIVTAGDRNYAWGIYLLLASIRRYEMKERILVGTYSWTSDWLNFLADWPNVKIIQLPMEDRRCVCVTKPMLMLKSETDYATWVDSDGIFTGDCSDYLYGEADALYARSYSPAEIANHSFARLPKTISTWLRDVGSLPERRNIPDICTSIVGVSLRHSAPLLEKWIGQMKKVLPENVGIVTGKKDPYYQTDESVLNSLLSCWEPAPEITKSYRLNNPRTAYYAHFAYNPKPWQRLWTSYSLRYYEQVISLMEWCDEQHLLPKFAPVPPSLLRRYEKFYKTCAPLSPYYVKTKKLLRKIGIKHRASP